MALYDSFASTFSESRRAHPWPEIDYIIDDIRPMGDIRILDVGCGNGRWLEECERLGYTSYEYLGIDNSSAMIDEAMGLHPEHDFAVVPMSELATLTAGYDVIVLLASYHHLEAIREREQVLVSLKHLLAPGGRIYMTNWNLLDQPRYAASHIGGGDFHIKIGAHTRYYHGFTLDELTDLFTSAGYDIIDHQVFSGGRNILSQIRPTS